MESNLRLHHKVKYLEIIFKVIEVTILYDTLCRLMQTLFDQQNRAKIT